MAIYRMIRESVFEPEAIERMTAAYENALKGETDPDRLCRRALEALGKTAPRPE